MMWLDIMRLSVMDLMFRCHCQQIFEFLGDREWTSLPNTVRPTDSVSNELSELLISTCQR